MSRYSQLARLTALKPVTPRATSAARESAGEKAAREAGRPDELALLAGGEVARNRFGEHVLVRGWHSEPAECPAAPSALRLLAPEAHACASDPGEWLFLDTETTGLAGGTGTYAFLIGVAWFDSGGLALEQYFMRDFGEEHALLEALAERLAKRRVLVTFNGKSFDWPLLETRYRMTRQIRAPQPRAHLDLLHASRQVWRLRLASLRLTELEKHVLGFDRGPDLWSAMIPQLYFDYLRGGPAGPLADVLRHNAMDLRGLAALAARLMALLAEPEAAACDALELYGLSRLLRRRGEQQRARSLYERALAAGLPAELDLAARRELARLAKRGGDFHRANELWDELSSGDTDAALEALEELAKHYEHRAREPRRAAELTRDALDALAAAHQSGSLSHAQHRRLRERLERRLARLETKRAATLPLRHPA